MTTITRRAARAALLLAAVAAMPATADAQIGGLRKKVAKAVAGATGQTQPESTSPAAAAEPAKRSPYNEYVLEMTDAVLDRLEKGLAAESARRDEVAAILAKVPAPEARAQCVANAAMLPEVQKALDEYMAALEKAEGNGEKLTAAAIKLDETTKVIYDRECGAEMPDDRLRELQKEPALAGAKAADFTEYQYASLKERVPPFCTAGDRLEKDGDGAFVPVDARNRYVYSATEIAALTPRCEKLSAAIAANS